MKNSITVSLPFSFKGKTFNPRCVIDLDEHMEVFASIPCLYTHLAKESGISEYSYEHDVMMMGILEFEKAEGLAAEFISNGDFDREGFQAKWCENRLDDQIQEVATRCMGIDQLEDRADLKKALLEAYQLGIKGSESGNKFTVPPASAFD